MTIKDVENLAELARIELSSTQKESLLKDIASILEYVKAIEQVEGSEDRTEHKIHNVWREDLTVQAGENNLPSFDSKLITGQFPDKKDGFLKVKKIL